MKKLLLYLLLAICTLTFSACAVTKSPDLKVKCPACGHEHTLPDSTPN